jgi:2-amino-4-hydroxy-6-hydroxymethyldihydropteridine diphosphokinase
LSARRPAEPDLNGVRHQVCLLLGSNIQPERNLPLAVRELPAAVQQLGEQLTILRVSSVWESPAVGAHGPNFLNAALLCRTSLGAEALKWQVLRPLEARLGRVRNKDKNAPRPIDVDIITVDGQLYDPLLWQYSFRAVPVAELLPDLASETGERLSEAARRLAAELPVKQRHGLSLDW